MADIADQDRQFLVYFRGSCLAGDQGQYELVDVPAGEDADELCQEAYDNLLANNSDGGWCEADPLEVAKLRKERLL